MLQDGFTCPAFIRFHALAKTEEDKNLHTALVLLLEKCCRLQHYFVKEISTGTVSVLVKPSAIFGRLHATRRHHFNKVFGADKAKLESFWANLFSTPEGKELQSLHPHLHGRTPEALCTSIPAILHEDAAPYSKRLLENGMLPNKDSAKAWVDKVAAGGFEEQHER